MPRLSTDNWVKIFLCLSGFEFVSAIKFIIPDNASILLFEIAFAYSEKSARLRFVIRPLTLN